MKKTISIILALGILAAFSSCGKDNAGQLSPITSDSVDTSVSQSAPEQENSFIPPEPVDNAIPQAPSSEPAVQPQPETSDEAPNAPGTQEQANKSDFVGSWICKKSDKGYNFMFLFSFFENGDTYYMAGWDESDMAADYEGSYTVNGENISITITDSLGLGGTLTTVMKPERVGNQLKLTLISGDPITYLQGVGDTLTFDPYESENPQG